MKEINIAATITNLRKEKGISQEVLAKFIGVSKAAVSKWETGQSYPDITLLPKLATYFDTSVDSLLDYQPEMPKQEIRKLYETLANAFHDTPIDEMITRCQKIIHEYYSCYPLLLQLGALYLNYACSFKSDEQERLLLESITLFQRVKNESNDANLIKQAQSDEATALLMLDKPKEVIALLADNSTIQISNEIIQASAYQLIGDNEKANYTIQVGIYQYLFLMIGQLNFYLSLITTDKEKFNQSYKRILQIADTFQFNTLHPTMLMNIYLIGAQGFMMFDEKNKALDAIESYANLVISDIYPLKLHGDAFFDKIDLWIKDHDFPFPKDQKTVNQNMIDAVIENAAFQELHKEERFQVIVKKIKQQCEEIQ